MRPRFEFASRFRILKGGKISLVISALIASVTMLHANPSGGVVTSGSASIAHNGSTTNITQSSQKASINWNKFNIASNETVNFNQPNINSITLNRVIGNERSIINGALNANGQVWILNSNGVLFGKNASVNTSGLLATTASLSDEAFQAGAYHFKNATSNTIINEGTIKVNNSSYVILASNETRNTGSIEAVKAKVHLVGANEYSINLNGNSLVDLTIEKGVMDALVENSGTIINKAGEIYLTTNAVNELLKGVVNHTGILEANSLDGITGKVELFAHGGEVQVGGTIKASEGFVETSGKDFKILDNATIEAGKWLIDPTNLTINSSLASSTQSQLKNGDVELEADEDITVSSDITWSTDKKLTLTAGDEIYVNAIIENTNSINGGVYFNAANTQNKVIFDTNGKVIINNVYQLQWMKQALNGTYELGSNINAGTTTTWNAGLGWDPIGDYNYTNPPSGFFKGTFDGNGYVIDSLYIKRPNENFVGLFGATTGPISNIGLTNVDITGNYNVGGLVGRNYYGTVTNSYVTGRVKGPIYVGGLVGFNSKGTVTNSYATGSVDGNDYVGGLVGDNDGTVTNSYATGSVDGNDYVGGLVGKNWGTISNTYSTEAVSGTRYVGGLVGDNDETLSNSYATGSVSGKERVGGLVGFNIGGTITNSYATGSVDGNDYVGGLVGYHYAGYNNKGTITKSYWDTDTSGQSSSAGGTGLTTEQFADMSTFSTWDSSIWELTPRGGSTVEGYEILLKPYLKKVTQKNDKDITTLFASGWGTEASPYTITAWAQLANIDFTSDTLTSGYYYSLSSNLDSSTTGYSTYASSNANKGKGWDPIGSLNSKFRGSIEGNGYTIDSLYINRTSEDNIGLFGYIANSSTISNVSVTNANITGNGGVGILAGVNLGTVSNSYSTGNAHGTSMVGGLVGENDGTIYNAYSTGDVSGEEKVGGLVGYNNYGTISKSYWDTDTSGQTNGIGAGDDTGVTGLTSAQMGYGGAYDSSWNIEVDNTLTSGNTPLLRYNADGSATWIIAPLTLSYTLENQSWTYDGNSYSLSSFYNDSSIIFGDDYSFIDFTYFSFIDSSDKAISSLKNAGTYSIGLSTTNEFLNIATSGNTQGTITINPKELTLSTLPTVEDKVYDGLTTTSASNSGTLSGFIGSETVSFSVDKANFENKNAGENKTVTVTYTLSDGTNGGLASNYFVSDTTTTANINKKEITATYIGKDKIYDGTTLANVNGSLVDAISGDSISLIQSANFEDKNAGTNKKINITNIALSGNDALNYTLTSPTTATTSANINKKGITAIYTAEDKTYDGTTLANVSGSLSDVISGDSVSLLNQSANFEDKNAGSNKQVNITNIALSGKDALNYTLISPTTATINANINKKEITATYSANDKTYDGTTLANVSGSLSDVISGDSVSINHATAKFADKNAGENKQVNITNIALSGDDALNYVVSDTTTSANINKKEITATYSADDKTYDGTTTATVSGSLDGGIISGDSVSLLNQSANFEDKNIGENKQVNITNIALSGKDALNYVVSDTTTSATINKKEITATYSADDKIYDGTTLANVSGSIEGILKGDKVSFIAGKGYFKDSIPGTNKTVYIEGFRLEGKDSKNYVLDADSYTTIASINIDLEDIIGSITNKEEYKIKNRFIHFNPIKKEIVLEIINGGIKLPKTMMTQSSFFNDSDNKGDEI